MQLRCQRDVCGGLPAGILEPEAMHFDLARLRECRRHPDGLVLSHRLTFGAKNVSACALWCRSSIWLELCAKLKLLRARASSAMARPTSANSSSSKVAPRASGAGKAVAQPVDPGAAAASGRHPTWGCAIDLSRPLHKSSPFVSTPMEATDEDHHRFIESGSASGTDAGCNCAPIIWSGRQQGETDARKINCTGSRTPLAH